MKFSQMNLRSGLMERVQRKLDESQVTENNNVNNDIDNFFSIQSTSQSTPLKPKIKVRQRERIKQNKGWMLR